MKTKIREHWQYISTIITILIFSIAGIKSYGALEERVKQQENNDKELVIEIKELRKEIIDLNKLLYEIKGKLIQQNK